MKPVILLCGDQPRHLFVANQLNHKLDRDVSTITFPRMRAKTSADQSNVKQQISIFGAQEFPTDAIHLSTHVAVVDLLINTTNDSTITLMFGYPNIFSSKELAEINGIFLNIHSGVLPYYRGVACNLVAAFLADHKNLGHTCHEVVTQIDAGGILGITKADPRKGDTLNSLEARSLEQMIDTVSETINNSPGVESIRASLKKQKISKSIYVRNELINTTFLENFEKLYPGGKLK